MHSQKRMFYMLSLLVVFIFLSNAIASGNQLSSPRDLSSLLNRPEGKIQAFIDQLSEQLNAEPYRAGLYYYLARAYMMQGWHDKAAQHMRQWLELSNSGLVVGDRHAFVIDENRDSVIVVDTPTGKVVREITVGWRPRVAVPTSDWSKVYVVNALANNVSAVSIQKLDVVKTIETGKMPWNAKASPEGDRIYVTNLKSDDVSIINTKSDTVVGTVKVGQGPWGIAISPDGHRLYISNQDSQNIHMIDTGSYSIIGVIGVGTHPRDIAIAPDNENRLYAVDDDIISDKVQVHIVDLEDARVVESLSVPAVDEPLLVRYRNMSIKDRLALIGSSSESDRESEQVTADPLLSAAQPDTAEESTIGPKELVELEPAGEAHEELPSVPIGKGVLHIIVVVKRDTLWQISMTNYGTVNDDILMAIQAANPAIKDVNKIYVGQRIRLPEMMLETEVPGKGKVVTVKANDNLFRIALRNYGIANDRIYDAILRANPRIKIST